MDRARHGNSQLSGTWLGKRHRIEPFHMQEVKGHCKPMAMASAERPRLLDADSVMDEIIAKKGPQPYKDGLSEDNWEQVRGCS